MSRVFIGRHTLGRSQSLRGTREVRRRVRNPDRRPDPRPEHREPGRITAFGKWKPEEGLTVHAFVANLNNGGYVFVEADDPKVVSSFVSKFFYWNDVNVVPVIDVADSVTLGTASAPRGLGRRQRADTPAAV